jgi:IclR family pca regulon transcriptional regulator
VTELDKVRQQAYAISHEEMAVGLRSVAAPVSRAMGQVVAAINISVSSDRVSRHELEAVLAPMVVDTARRISLALSANMDHSCDGVCCG